MKNFLIILFLVNSLLANIAIVSAFKGKATVQRDTEVLDVALGFKILKQDILKTQNDTKVQLLFNDDTMITIGTSY